MFERDVEHRLRRFALSARLLQAAFVAGVGLVIAGGLELPGDRYDMQMAFVGMGIIALIGARQMVALHANAKLIRALDERVAERTGELETQRARAERQSGELAASQRILLSGAAGTALGEATQAIARGIGEHLGYQSVAIALVDLQDPGTLRCVAGHGFSGAAGCTLSASEGMPGEALRTGRPQLAEDVSGRSDRVTFREDARAVMTAPITVRGATLGVIQVESSAAGAFTEADVHRVGRLAPQAGLIISNAQLLQRERESVQRLTELDRMRTEFIAITSHELRTPLTAISGFVKTLRNAGDRRTPELVDTALEVMDRQGDRLVTLVEELLVASKLQAQTVSVRPQPVRVLDLVRHALEPLGAGAARVQVDIDPLVPVLQLDPQRLGQVLTNLVGNALKFSTRDDVVVKVTRDRASLILEVADRGPGIAPEHRTRIFEPFYQVEDYMRREAGGFGLGLHITQTIVEALAGTIEADARPGGGSVFRVRMPLVAAENVPAGWLSQAERTDAIRRRLHKRRMARPEPELLPVAAASPGAA